MQSAYSHRLLVVALMGVSLVSGIGTIIASRGRISRPTLWTIGVSMLVSLAWWITLVQP